MWYRQPGSQWMQGMPLGNGMIGAMVFGGVPRERIALNESSFWSGRPHDYDDPNAGKYFKQIQDLVFAQRHQEATNLATEHFMGIPKVLEAYQPIGDLLLSFADSDYTDYRRELDMKTGVAKVTYRQEDAVITRETFVSWPDKVLVTRISSDKPGKVNFEAKFQGPYLETSVAEKNTLVMDGQWVGPFSAPSTGMNGLIARTKGKGLRYEASLVARVEGGESEASGDTLKFKNADAVTLVMSIATSYVNYKDISGDPVARCKKVLDDVSGKDYVTLYRRHVDDFKGLMSRVNLSLGNDTQNEQPIDRRLQGVRNGTVDLNLQALVFQFGRYILVSSSREGGQPPGLQAIWDEAILPPWGAKYTTNINFEMNYWPAEVCNLTECTPPLFELIRDLSEGGARTAKTYYHSGGWVVHHNTDLWRASAPVDYVSSGMWPCGGTWLCQFIWEHYLYTGDVDFLRENYPVMKGAAQFLMDVMIVEPEHNWLIIPFSLSPEEGGTAENGQTAYLSKTPTINIALIKDLFPHVIEAEKILNVDQDFGAKLAEALTKIPPFPLTSDGNLKTWIENWRNRGGHSTSPAWGLFPGNSITLRGTPELAAAVDRWVSNRRSRADWGGAWNTIFFARLEQPEKVEPWFGTYMRSINDNLHNRVQNQSDASFGFTALIAESLLQSHAGELSFLPALPPSWTSGSINGLRARGGYEVAMDWNEGKLQSVTIKNSNPSTFKVRYGDKASEVSIKAGQTVHLDSDLKVVE